MKYCTFGDGKSGGVWRWWWYWLRTWSNSIFERDRVVWRMSERGKKLFQARTNKCIYISCRICYFHSKTCTKFFLLLGYFFCINFYYTELTFFLFLQMYIQYWVRWSLPLCHWPQQLRLFYAHSVSFFQFKFIWKQCISTIDLFYIVPQFSTEYFHALAWLVIAV